jgi:hypothetical protein
MPNWVYNGLTIEGNPDSVKKLMEQMNQPFSMVHDSWDVSTNSFMKKNTLYPNPVFAFWNIIKPTDMDTYMLQEDPKVDKTTFNFNGDNWYDWNVRNWGTKWDVAVSSEDKYPDTNMEDAENGENYVVHYNFNTAWSRPMGALTKLSEQYPDLLFTLSYEEETGWGGECEILRGIVISDSEYETKCRECDEIDCLEYDDEKGVEICQKCGYES